MSEHIDVDTSGLLQREINLDQAGDKLLECMLRTANGRLTAAEALGHREFVMTRLYETPDAGSGPPDPATHRASAGASAHQADMARIVITRVHGRAARSRAARGRTTCSTTPTLVDDAGRAAPPRRPTPTR